MQYIRQILCNDSSGSTGYPFNQPLIHHLADVDFSHPVTVFTGDNGAGKTTLLEILAQKFRAVRVGGAGMGARGQVVAAALSSFSIKQNRKPRQTFYFTAEDFVKYLEWSETTQREAYEELERVEREYTSEYAKEYARMPFASTLDALNNMYANTLTQRSHGEGFLDFFRGRLGSGGLYIMDEPEGALSYENQFVLALMIRDAVARQCQFVLATHSPVLSAIPDAAIYYIDQGKPIHTTYEQLPDVQFLQLFLQRRDRFFQESL